MNNVDDSAPQPAPQPVHSDPAQAELLADEALVQQLVTICERCGAAPERSGLMARQLLKRARQLAVERDWSEAQALEYLLRLMIEGSQGGGVPHPPS